MVFAGVFDRFPRLKVGSVEHETAWIPHWLKQMDFTYRERPVFTKGWKSVEAACCRAIIGSATCSSSSWRTISASSCASTSGSTTCCGAATFPHAESTWPQSKQFLDRIFEGVPEEDRRKITADNAAKLFGFHPN